MPGQGVSGAGPQTPGDEILYKVVAVDESLFDDLREDPLTPVSVDTGTPVKSRHPTLPTLGPTPGPRSDSLFLRVWT